MHAVHKVLGLALIGHCAYLVFVIVLPTYLFILRISFLLGFSSIWLPYSTQTEEDFGACTTGELRLKRLFA